jgi:alkanesulfonate monooxygenase SsuD/methylene tetrahydromethanopterin reductase-like flavin-dependent oxidoreductase (luciferase family)
LKAKEKNKNIKFGCYIYQDGLEYKDILHITMECEKLGYDSVWLKDNFIPWILDYISVKSNTDNNNSSELHREGKYQEQNQKQQYKQKPTERMMLECWTTLSSLVSVTAKIRLGAIFVNLYRNPAIVAKMASTLDFISNGRLDIGLSAGWYEKEAHAYGVAFPPGSVRVEMLEESVIILRQMLSAEKDDNNGKISFKGRYYSISNADCNPKPIQKPHIPIWIGGGGKRTLKVVAKYADGWNYGLCSYDEYTEKLSVLKNYCASNNTVLGSRNYDDIIKAWHGILILGLDETELRNRKINISYKKGIRKDSKLVIAGTPKTILDEIKRYLNIGVTYFTVYFPDLPDTRSLELFAEHIIHHFRNRD